MGKQLVLGKVERGNELEYRFILVQNTDTSVSKDNSLPDQPPGLDHTTHFYSCGSQNLSGD